jgi:hypothetical protein
MEQAVSKGSARAQREVLIDIVRCLFMNFS